MKKNISKKLSKATILLVAFVALTMVFTIYQTSINNKLNDALEGTDLSILEETLPIAHAYTSAVSNMSSLNTAYTTASKYEMGRLDYTRSDTSSDITLSANLTRASYGSVLGFTASFYVKYAGHNRSSSEEWKVTAHGASTTTSATASGNSDSTTYSASATCPAGTTKFTGYYYGNRRLLTDWWEINNLNITLTTSDSTAPTFSLSNEKKVYDTGHDGVGESFTITDDGAGLWTVTYDYYDLAGKQQVTGSYALNKTGTLKDDYVTSHDFGFTNGYGIYDITATDNVGNNNTITLYYYSSNVTASPSDSSFGQVAVGDNALIDGESVKTTAYTPDTTYSVYATAKEGYFFTGWSSSFGGAASLTETYGYGSYNTTKNAWETSYTIPAWDTPKYSEFAWTAQYQSIHTVLLDHEKKGFISTTQKFTYPYDGDVVTISTTIKSTDNYKAEITYLDSNGNQMLDYPKYAGNYTIKVTIYNKQTTAYVLGTASYPLTIKPIDIYLKPNIASSKNYDGTTFATQTENATTGLWTYDDVGSSKNPEAKTVAETDELSFVNIADDIYFTYAEANVGTWVITTNYDANKKATTAAKIDSDNTALIGSYILHTKVGDNKNGCGDDVKSQILPIPLVIESLGYSTYAYNKDDPSFTNPNNENYKVVYVNGEKFTSSDKSYYGKVYDGTDDGYINGIKISGFLTTFEESFAIVLGTEQYDFTPTDGTFTFNQKIHSSFDPANEDTDSAYACDTNDLKTSRSDSFTISGDTIKNYIITINDTPQNSAYAGGGLSIVTNDILVTQKPIDIAFSSTLNTSKVYDGNDTVTDSAYIDWTWTTTNALITIGTTTDPVTIDFGEASIVFNSAEANYNPITGTMFGNPKTITISNYSLVDSNSNGNNSTKISNNYHLKNTTYELKSADYSQENYESGACFVIKTREISISTSAVGKVYDGTTIMLNKDGESPTLNYSNVLEDDKNHIALEMVEPTFPSADVNNYKDVTTNVTLSGDKSNNYHLPNGTKEDTIIVENANSEGDSTATTLSITAKNSESYEVDENDTKVYDVISSLDKTSLTYTSIAQTPVLTIIDTAINSQELVAGVDYTIQYFTLVLDQNNKYIEGDSIEQANIKNVGTYRIYIEFTKNYSGNRSIDFEITKAPVEVIITGTLSSVYGEKVYNSNIDYGNYSDSFGTMITVVNAANPSVTIEGSWYFVDTPSQYLNAGKHTFEIKFVCSSDFNSTYLANYQTVSNQMVTLVISKLDITISAKAQSMTFGDSTETAFINTAIEVTSGAIIPKLDNGTPVEISDFGTVTSSILTKKYPTAQTELVDLADDSYNLSSSDFIMATTYEITLNKDIAKDKSIETNYNITWVDNTFTVNRLSVDFTANPTSKIYGEDDPTLTYTTNLPSHLFFVGKLARAEGNNVGSYKILQGTILPEEYKIENNIIVTPILDTKPSTDPSIDYFKANDITVYYNVINYTFTSFNLENRLTAEGATENILFTITHRLISIDLSQYNGNNTTHSNIFGETINLSNILEDKIYTIGEQGLAYDDDLAIIIPNLNVQRMNENTGIIATSILAGKYDLSLFDNATELYNTKTNATGENAITYGNYQVYIIRCTYTITLRPVTIVPKGATKTYGHTDPDSIHENTIVYTGDDTKVGLLDSYRFTVKLLRSPGEDVGTWAITGYEITEGSALAKNYDISFKAENDDGTPYASLTITPLAVKLNAVMTEEYHKVSFDTDRLNLLNTIKDKTRLLNIRKSFDVSHVTISKAPTGVVINDEIKTLIVDNGGGLALPQTYEHPTTPGTMTYPTSVDTYSLILNQSLVDDTEGKFKNYTFSVGQATDKGSFIITPLTAKIKPTGIDENGNLSLGALTSVYGDPLKTITYTAEVNNQPLTDSEGNLLVGDDLPFSVTLKLNNTNYKEYPNGNSYLQYGSYNIVIDSFESENYLIELDTQFTYAYHVTARPVTVTLNNVINNTIAVIYGNDEPIIPMLDATTTHFDYTFTINGLLDQSDSSLYAYNPAAENPLILTRDAGNDVKTDGSAGYQIKCDTNVMNSINSNYTFQEYTNCYLAITPRPILFFPVEGVKGYYGNDVVGLTYGAVYFENDIPSTEEQLSGDIADALKNSLSIGTNGTTPVGYYFIDSNFTNETYTNYEFVYYTSYFNTLNNSNGWNYSIRDFYNREIDSLNAEEKELYETFLSFGCDLTKSYYEVIRRPVKVQIGNVTGFIFGSDPSAINYYKNFTNVDDDPAGEWSGLIEGETLNGTPGLPDCTLLPKFDDYGEAIGYPINAGSITNDNNPNYDIRFENGDFAGKLYVDKRTITLTPIANQKQYMKEMPDLDYNITGSFVDGYTPIDENGEFDRELVFSLSVVFDEGKTALTAQPKTYKYAFNIETEYPFVDGTKLSECYTIVTESDAASFTIMRAAPVITIDGAIADPTDISGRSYTLDLQYNGNNQLVSTTLGAGKFDAEGNETGSLEFRDMDENLITELLFKDAGNYQVEIIPIVDGTKFIDVNNSLYLTINIKKYALAEVDPTDENYGLALEKIYGEADGNLEFQINGIGTDGKLSASLKREEGEAVGSYDITEIIFVNSNYEVSFKACSYEIKAKALEITPNNIENSTKIYGEADGELYEDIDGVNDETLRVIYSRSAGENVGKYDVAFSKVIKLTTDEFGAIVPVKDEFGNYVENANYSVTLADGTGTEKYEITKRKATVTAVSVQKVFDSIAVDLDSLSYNTENVVSGETLVGSITILTGAPVEAGTYAIVLEGFNEAPENSNYDITLVNATCVISPAPISIKAVSVTYEYGDTIADFDYEVSGTVYAGYPLEGKLALGANNQIVSGTLNNNEGRNPNYKITYLSGGVCTITPRHITITVTASVEQVYGDELTTIPYAVTSANGLADGDEALLGSLAPSGKDVNLDGYTIEMGTLQELNPNYLITLETADHKYIITPRPISVTVEPKTIVYGDEPIALEYTAEGLIGEETLNGELYCDLGTDAKSYPITQGTLNHPNYEITTFNGADYTITPRAIVVTIKDAESDFGQEIAELEWYISKGRLIGQDDLGIVLTKAEGTTMGTYEITGSFNNDNYTVEFVNGTYTIHKYQAVITVANQFITFIEDGDARSIQAECSSGAEIIFTVKGEEVSNYFREAGKYTVELTAPETDNYYAPEEVIVYITINRPVLKTEANGIDVTLTNENGFDPNLSIEMEKLPTDYMDMIAELTSKQKIVRAFTLTSINEDTLIEEVEGKTTVTIKVPTMLSEQETVQVLVREDGEYDIIEVEVLDGYVTLEVDSLSSFAFITEENTNYLLLILIGVASLIMLGSVMVFLFRKRA